jgi:lipoate-protein ligase A
MEAQYIKDNYAAAEWRVIQSGFDDGPKNMAVDEAILEAVGAGLSPPSLRIFGWNPGCLALGWDQSWEIVDVEACAASGWDVVRGLAPGRAVLHLDDLTASVVVPVDDPRVAGTDLDRFRRVSAAFVAALKALGLDPDRSRPYYQDHGPLGPACFDGPSKYQVTIGGRKVICGSVTEGDTAMLFKCTIPLFGEIKRISKGLRFDFPGQRLALEVRIGYRAATLESLLGQAIDFEDASAALRQGFTKALNVKLSESDLSRSEVSRASQLLEDRYSRDSWTKKL